MTLKIRNPSAHWLLLVCSLCLGQSATSADVLLANVNIAGNEVPTEAVENAPASATPAPSPPAPAAQPANTEVQAAPAVEPTGNVTSIKSTPIKNPYKLTTSRGLNVNETQKPRQIEFHGSINNQSVYLILEKSGKRDVVGYLFDGKGQKKYVYGEWINNSLQIYDPNNKKSTVLLGADEANPDDSSPTPENTKSTLNSNNTEISVGSEMKQTTVINNPGNSHSSHSTEIGIGVNSDANTGKIGIH